MTRKQKIMLLRILLTLCLTIPLSFVPAEGVTKLILYLVPYLLIGYDILWEAGIGVAHGQLLDENFLMAVATVGALLIGFTRTGDYLEAIAVMLFYQVGELFQSYAVGKSRRNIAALMDIRPDYANIRVDGALVQTDPEEVAVGSIIVVNPGEKVPIDGTVVSGTSTLNTSALTGESLPREVQSGDEIISGCINLTGVLEIRTTREFGDSTVSKILDLVENATSAKSRSEHLQVCPVLHPHCLRCSPGSGGAAAPCSDAFPVPQPRLVGLGISGPDLPGHQLSLRFGHQHSPDLLCRNRRSQPGGDSGEGLQLSGSPGSGGDGGI